MKVKILKPRLDVTFKKGPVPGQRGPIAPIRVHWQNFVDNLYEYHKKYKNDDVEIIEKPLWQFDIEYVTKLCIDNDRVYMPHKQKHNFNVPSNCLFYMQTVFPNYFTVDNEGWGANLSWAPVEPFRYQNHMDTAFLEMQLMIMNNQSKFDQPAFKDDWKLQNYYLFICQIPHDETILYHSEVSVYDSLRAVLEWGKKNDFNILVKGHPVNPGSMSDLIKLTSNYENAKYIDNISIHQCIKNAHACFTVNSGSGFEVILHEKPLVCFGRAEYTNVVPKADLHIESINEALKYDFQLDRYKSFIFTYLKHCIDSNSITSFIGSKHV